MHGVLLASVILQIAIYDNSGGRSNRYPNVRGEIARIFKAAGVQVQFREGSPSADEVGLITVPETPRRGEEAKAACRARVDIALELMITAPQGMRPQILGVAIPFAERGLNARVFLDRVERIAERQGLQPGIVAAHAVAHEIGHVLTRIASHSPSGLMAGPWGNHEFRRMTSGLLLFSDREAEMMRASIRGEGCPSPTPAITATGKPLNP